MGSLDVWGAIAASVLLIQCIVLNLIFVALALGLWKGSEWLRVNAGRALVRLAAWLQTGRRYALQGQAALSAPFVRTRARVVGWRTAWQRLKAG